MAQDLEEYKDAYKAYLTSVQNSAPWVLPVDDAAVRSRVAYVDNYVNSFEDLLTLAAFRFPQLSLGYRGVEPLDADADLLAPQDKVAPVEWHAMYGMGDGGTQPCFVVSIMRLDVAPDYPLYIANGGVTVDGKWKKFPYNALRGAWTTDPVGVHHFDCEKGKDCTAVATIGPSSLSYTFSFPESKDPAVFGGTLTVITVNPGPLVLQSRDGCVPVCFGGVGTSYCSFPHIKEVDLTVGGRTESLKGWFDHQWMNVGMHGLLPIKTA